MAPSTALVYLLLGGALVLLAHFPDRPWVRKFVLVSVAFTGLVLSFVIFCLLTDRVPRWEYWLGAADVRVHGNQAGRMSLNTGGMIALSLFGLALQFFRSREKPVLQGAGVLASILAGYLGLLSVMARLSGVPLVASLGFGVLSTVSALELAVFNAAVLLSGDTTGLLRHWFFGAEKTGSGYAAISREENRVIALLAALGALTLVSGVIYLHHEANAYRTRSIEALRIMSDFKVAQIERWRHERLGDARTLMRMPGLGANVLALADGSADSQRAEFVGWLRQYVQDYGYANVVVFDAALQPVFSEPGGVDFPAAELRERMRTLRPDPGVIELPPYRDVAGRLRWDLLVPLPAGKSPAFAGAILLQTNPGKYVIPVLQSWPAEYETGQSMLWHREGDRLVSLGGYRPVPGTAPDELRPFGMTRAISDPRSQSMLTRVVRGDLTAGEDRDHRGEMVLGLGRPIADSPWFLSSRVDSREVFAPLRNQVIGITSGSLGLLAVAGLATGLLWRQRQKILLHGRVTAELEQKRLAARLGLVMRHANDMIFLTDESRRFLEVNQQAVAAYGWTKEELLRLSIGDLRAPEVRSTLAADLELAEAPEGAIYETVHCRKDGTPFPVEISVRRVEIEGERHVLSIIRDISERKRAEAKLKDSEEKFSKAFQANPSGIALTELASGRFIEVNESYCRIMGYSPREVIGQTSVELGIWGSGEDRSQMFKPLFDVGSLRNFELKTRTRDGEAKTILVSAELIELNGRRCVLSLIEDITERRAQQDRIEQLGRMYRVLGQINEVIFRSGEKIGLLNLACQTLVESGRFTLAWVRWHNPATRTLEPLAQAGNSGYAIVVKSDGQPEGLGTSGTSFRENRTYVCNDFFADPSTAPWREAAQANGIRSSISIPIRQAGAPVAVLAVYAEKPGFFGIEETALLEKAAANLSFALDTLAEVERRQASDEALRASEERYRLIADNTSDVIWLYDLLADQFTYASPSVLPLLGRRPEEILGRKLLDFVAPVSHEAARRVLEQALRSAAETGEPVHLAVELEQQRKDGSLVPTEVVTSVLSDGSGRVTHILGVTRDITERRKAREVLEKFNSELEEQVEARTAELAARNREIEALVKSIPDTVLLCDEHGELVTSHFARSRASSSPFASVGGGDGLSAHHPVLLEIARELHAVAWATQGMIAQEYDRHINGADYSIEARATPAGENRLLILLRDISARKRGERIAQANLERERQLSEMKTQFISVASHEFRTPLAAATGSLELLERHAARITEAKRVELLKRAQLSLGRLTAIMDNVLQLSRADSGRVKVKRTAIDLGQFVPDLIHEAEAGDRQQHAFAFQAAGLGNAVPVDTNLFNHILSNLLGNAVRYSPAGTKISVTLDIGAQSFSLTVADEGIGIPEAERERVFEPFARGSNVGHISGTGLGLNIVKRYTELMGGRIELLPTERGAAFRVELPFN